MAGINLELIQGLGMARYRGAEEAVKAKEAQMGLGLKREQLRQAPLQTKRLEQDVQLKQFDVDEKIRFQKFEEDVSNQWKANPEADVFSIIQAIAPKYGLPAQLVEAYTRQNKLAEEALKTLVQVHAVYGPEKAKEFSRNDPNLKKFGEPNIQEAPEGFQIVWKEGMAFLVQKDGKVTPLKTGTEAKQINMPSWYDAMATEKLGERYNTSEGQKEFANYLQTPEGKRESSEYRRKYAIETATPFYQVVPTEKGLETFASREGKFVEPKAGEQLRKKMLSPELIDFEGKMGVLETSLSTVMDSYDPSFVGAAAGRLGGLREMTIGIPKEQARFYSSLARIKANMVYLLSGKQINETEYTRLLEQLPRRELPSDVFEARMEDFRKTMEALIESRRQAAGGYAIPERGGAAKDQENLRKKYNY